MTVNNNKEFELWCSVASKDQLFLALTHLCTIHASVGHTLQQIVQLLPEQPVELTVKDFSRYCKTPASVGSIFNVKTVADTDRVHITFSLQEPVEQYAE